MASSRSVMGVETYLWVAGIVVLAIAAASGVPPYLLAILTFCLTKLREPDGDDRDEEGPFRPALSSARRTPVRPQAADRDHPRWDLWLDG